MLSRMPIAAPCQPQKHWLCRHARQAGQRLACCLASCPAWRNLPRASIADAQRSHCKHARDSIGLRTKNTIREAHAPRQPIRQPDSFFQINTVNEQAIGAISRTDAKDRHLAFILRFCQGDR